MDGTVAAYRFPYLLAGDSIVFKQDSPYYEHFYKELKPFIHYVPFKRDLSDLTTKIKWAMDNNEDAKEIAQNGQSFARDNLMPKDVFCYYAVALNVSNFFFIFMVKKEMYFVVYKITFIFRNGLKGYRLR